jgi:hypothetical protein
MTLTHLTFPVHLYLQRGVGDSFAPPFPLPVQFSPPFFQRSSTVIKGGTHLASLLPAQVRPVAGVWVVIVV